MPRIRSDLPEAVCPVVAAPREYLHSGVSKLDLHAVAIELDLVDPAIGTFSIKVANAGSMNPG